MSGAAYIYERSGDTWSQVTKLKASDAEHGANFGSSVALFGLGFYAIIGAPNQDGMGFETGDTSRWSSVVGD